MKRDQAIKILQMMGPDTEVELQFPDANLVESSTPPLKPIPMFATAEEYVSWQMLQKFMNGKLALQ